MQRRVLLFVCLLAAASAGCGRGGNGDNPVERPGGLRNMAARPVGEGIQEGLDVEPNGTFLQAVDVTLKGDSISWSGTLESGTPGGDVDVWHIKAKAGTVADISVEPYGDFDVIADYAPSPSESVRKYYDVAGAGASELLPGVRLTPAGGYLTVRGREPKSENGGYVVNVRRVRPPEEGWIIESEPDDVPGDAVLLPSPGKADARLYPAGDVDYYRLQISAPSSVSFVLPAAAIEVSIIADGKVVWRSVGRTARTVRSDILSPGTGMAYAVVRSLEHIPAPLGYSVEFAPIEVVPDEIEPNDTPERAQWIEGDTRGMDLGISGTSDVDMFRLRAERGKKYSFQLEALNCGGEGCPSEGIGRPPLKMEISGADDGAVSDQTTACGVSASGSELLIKIASAGLTVRYPVMYRISVSSEDAASMESEPNGTVADATVITPGRTVYGNIFPAGDVDVYRISVPGAEGVTGPVGVLGVDLRAGYPAAVEMKLRDADGYEISRVSGTPGRPLHMAFDAPAGDYDLEVTGGGDGCAKPYAINVLLGAVEVPAVVNVGDVGAGSNGQPTTIIPPEEDDPEAF